MITNPLKSFRKHLKSPSQKDKKRNIFWKQMFRAKRFLQKSTSYGSSGRSAWGKILVRWFSNFHTFLKNVKSQWDFLTNRELELIYKARQMRNQKVIWYKNVFTLYLFYVSSRPGPISEKLFFKPFLKSGFWLLITETFLGIRPIGCW